MKEIQEWIFELWKEKKFRLTTILMLIVLLGICAEFFAFHYSILKSIRYLYLLVWLYVLAWIDRKKQIVPNKILLILLISRLLLLVMECIFYQSYWVSILISAFMGGGIAGGMFLLCYALTKGGVGAGDIKLFAVLGLYLGSGAIFSSVFLTVVYAAVYSLLKLLLKKTDLKQEIAFVPFIFLGTITTIILGV